MQGMSKQQRLVYEYMEKYYAEKGIRPSIQDIADGLGLGNSTVVTYIQVLKKKGYVTSRPRIPRSLIPIKQAGYPAKGKDNE